MARLKKGDRAPDFELTDQNGVMVSLVDYRGKKVLLYFYPKAMTSGCTLQSESVRDAQPEFEGLGVVSLGVSPDEILKQKKFDDKYDLGFPLLSDPDHVVAEAYGVWGEKNMGGKKSQGIIRSAFLISEEGKIIESWYKVKPEDTVPNSLDALK